MPCSNRSSQPAITVFDEVHAITYIPALIEPVGHQPPALLSLSLQVQILPAPGEEQEQRLQCRERLAGHIAWRHKVQVQAAR